MEVSVRLVGSAAFKAVGTSDPRPAGSIPVHLRQFARRRIRALIAAALGFLVVSPAGVALADPARPGNTESIVESVTPSSPGARFDIVGSDAFVRVQVERGHELTALGYQLEPFFRIDKNGDVWVNELSTTLEVSAKRYGTTSSATDSTSPTNVPEWKRVATNGSYIWHDHRVHWMSPSTPPTLNDDGLVQRWSIPFFVDGKTVSVSGALYLRDAPGSWWWLLAIPAVVIGFALSRRGAPRELAAAGAVFAVIGAFMFWGLPSQARGTPATFTLGILAVIISVVTAVFRHRGEVVDALVASAAVALLVAVVIEREAVTNRFVPGLGDSIVSRLAVPLIAGLALGTGAHALKRLVGKPEPIASK